MCDGTLAFGYPIEHIIYCLDKRDFTELIRLPINNPSLSKLSSMLSSISYFTDD